MPKIEKSKHFEKSAGLSSVAIVDGSSYVSYAEFSAQTTLVNGAATATITITTFAEFNNGDKVNLVATDGTNYDFVAGDQSSVNGTFEATTSNNATATNLMNVINTSSGPAGTRFTATVSGAIVTVAQAAAGTGGNTTVTITETGGSALSKTDFAGGCDKCQDTGRPGDQRKHAAWWKYRAERDRAPFTYNKTSAQLQWNEVRRLQRERYIPVKDFYEIQRTYHAGANPKRKQNVNYIYGKYEEEKTIDAKSADGIYVEFYTQSVDDAYGLPFKAVDDGLDRITSYYVDPKRKMPMRCYDGNVLDDPGREYYRQERLPFTVFSSSITASDDLAGLAYNISLENMHLDSYGEIPLQGPWTEKNVGGYQYRHDQLFVASDIDFGARAAATFTVADGDAASGMTEKESVTIIATDGTTRAYTIVDDNATTVATGDVLATTSDAGAEQAGAHAAADFVGTAALAGEDGTNLILTNADGSTVTFHTDPAKGFGDTSSDGGDHTWIINTGGDFSSDGIRKATQAFHIACLTAIAAGELDMTAVPATDTGTQTSFTLTQTTAGTAGNKAITLITGMTADGETAFTDGAEVAANSVAVAINTTGTAASQNDFLVQLKAAIEHANGHNGSIFVSAVPVEANGAQSITLTQDGRNPAGNTVTTTDISQLTAGNFIGGFADLAPRERSEGYRVGVDVTNNLITVRNPRIVNGTYDLNKPIGKYTREEYAKRPVSIRNIRTVSASANQYHSIGNYSASYEIIQTAGRDVNNRFITRGGKISLTETNSPYVSSSPGIPVVEYEMLDRSGGDLANSHIFVERFSAPGGILESSPAYLDIESGQYSPYNALPWRNYNIRRALDTLYTRHSLSGGYDSSTPLSASYHKTPRNTLRRPNKFYAGPDHPSPIASSASISYDNWFVSRQIPRTELQYSWVRDASVYVFSAAAAATATITITDYTELNAGDKVNLVATDGTNYNFTQGDQSSVNGTFEATTSHNQTATNLMNVINTSSGPSGTRFSATVDGAVVTVTQNTAGTAGNTTVTLTDSGTAGMTKTDFAGGQDIGSDLVDMSTLTASAYLPFFGYDYSTGAEDISFVSKSEGIVNVGYAGDPKIMSASIDFAGMNTVFAGVIETSETENTLHSGSNFFVNENIDLSTFSDSEPYIPYLYQNYNGPYGYPSWKQLRGGEHPVARALVAGNIYENEVPVANAGGKSTIKRYRINQTPITNKHSSAEFNLNKDGAEYSINLPFGNNYHFFTKDRYVQSAASISDFNDEFGIYPNYKGSEFVKMADEPWNIVNYSEVVFPRDENVGKSIVVSRPNYESFWKNTAGPDNTGATTVYPGRVAQRTNSQGESVEMSSWPMEVITGSLASSSSGKHKDYSGELMRFDTCFLNDTYGPAAHDACDAPASSSTSTGVNARFGRFYGHCRPNSEVTIQEFPGSPSPGLPPFPETYAGWSADISTRAKVGGYSILPEFRMSSYIPSVLGELGDAANFYEEGLYQLEVIGADTLYTENNSLLLETYSHSDTIQNLDVLRSHYGEPDAIELTMDMVTKFRPEKEFYPVFRTLDLAQQFSQSYGKHADLAGPKKTWRTVLTPFYSPGIMYNSIKAGIAVDYPFVDQKQEQALTAPTGGCHDVYENRMPFEAILEPGNYAQQVKRLQSNPVYQKLVIHDFDNEIPVNSTGSIGTSDGIYEQMAHNFFAETIDFYTQHITTVKSNPVSQWQKAAAQESLWNGGTNKMTLEQVANGVADTTSTSYIKKFAMDIFLKKKGSWAQSTAPHWFGPFPYVQHVPPYFALSPALANPDNEDRADFVGSGWSTVCIHGTKCCKSATLHVLNPTMSMGENESYMRVVFDPTAIAAAEPERFLKGQFTLSDIANNSLTSFVNVGMENQLGSTPVGAMPLSASLNVFSLGDDDRWTIAPKWESIIQNYAEAGRAVDYNIGDYDSPFPSIWQQQGANFTNAGEGLFLQVKTPDLGTAGDSDSNTTGSLVDICGFELDEKKIGVVKYEKPVQEGIAVIPFYTDNAGKEKFFNIPIKHFEEAYATVKAGQAQEEDSNSIVDLINKMRKYVMIPQFDFVKTRDDSAEPLVTIFDYYKKTTMMPFAMYIFEATLFLNTNDLQAHWGNNSGRPMVTTIDESGDDAMLFRVKIGHPIKDGEVLSPEILKLAGFDGKLPSNLRFKIFKIKYKAQTNYYDTYEKYTNIPNKHNYQAPDYSFNWPYDYFSLAELAKLKVTLQVNKKEEE